MTHRWPRLALLALPASLMIACSPERESSPNWDPLAVEAFVHPTAALLVPGASRAFLLQSPPRIFNGEWQLRFECDDPSWTSAKNAPIRWSGQRGSSAGWEFGDDRLTWTISAVVPPGPGTAKNPLVCSIEVQVHNRGAEAATADLTACLERPSPMPFVARDAHLLFARPLRWRAAGGTEFLAGAGPVASSDSSLRVLQQLPSGSSARWRFAMPSHSMNARALGSALSEPHLKASARASAYWARELGAGARIEIPDPILEAAWDEALIVLLGCSEGTAGEAVPIGGSFHYRDTWIRDGARQISALAEAGHLEIARSMARSLLEYQLPGGALMSQRGQLDGIGQALWAIREVQVRAPSSAAIAPVNAIVEAWQWCERQREIVRRVESRAAGLMPPADPRDAELLSGYHVGTDLWTLIGYRSARELLTLAGEHTAAARVESPRVDYEREVLRHLADAREPGVPAAWFGRARPWGNLIVQYPAALLTARHSRVHELLREHWSNGLGRIHYGTPDSLHGYLGMDLAVTALLQGSPEGWDSTLARTIAWRTATGGGAEIYSDSLRDFGTNLAPHATSAAAVMSLLRKGLVLETDDTLRITTGTREAWWDSGFGIRSTPTRWGPMELSARRRGVDLRWEWTALNAPAQLSGPPGTIIESVISPSGARLLDGVIHVPATTGMVHARARVTR